MTDDSPRDSLLREIDEEVRRERLKQIWNRYGTAIVAAVLVLAAAAGGYRIWQGIQARQGAEASAKFQAAMAQIATDPKAGEEQLQALSKDAPGGYAQLALLQQAAVMIRLGDREGARGVYKTLQQSAADPLIRDLAVILEADLALEQEALPVDAEQIRQKLEPLLADRNPFRYSARELAAIIAWRSGDVTSARSLLTALSTDLQAPTDMRDRASQMLNQVGEG